MRVEHLRKAYGDHVVLPDVSLTVYRGDRIGIIGPNGAGKTTLLAGSPTRSSRAAAPSRSATRSRRPTTRSTTPSCCTRPTPSTTRRPR
ncbi:MAG: ATP-binding cassette domain-containing protein [Sandaracinaceae bacterium]